MNVTGKFLLAFLCISIASYGLSGSVYATNHNILPFMVDTNSESYSAGDTILISGFIRNYDGKVPNITIQIFDPKGSFVDLCQITAKSDGTFSCTARASDKWSAGEYSVKALWNYQPADAKFVFVGGAAPEPTVDEDAAAKAAAEKAAAEKAAAEKAAAEKAAAEVKVVEAEPEIEPEPVMVSQPAEEKKGGGCLIATAAFGSEMAPQIQFLRELRDNTVLQTESGTSFMAGFNQFYYSFSPTVADYERENPTFKEAVKLTLTPLLTSLTLLHYADIDSESEMLGYGIGVILLNIGMYFIAPAILIMTVRKRI